MFKNIFFFLAVFFCVFFITPTIFAADPLGCLFGGLRQDMLILGEVASTSEDSQDIKIIFVFPQNKVKTIKTGDRIIVKNLTDAINLTDKEVKNITVGKKYLMSLNKSDNFYIPVWGIYEVRGDNYSDMQLVKNESIDDEAIQIFINSGGTESDFAFDWSGDEPVLIRKGENQEVEPKEKNILWYGVGIGTLIIVLSLVFVIRKKK